MINKRPPQQGRQQQPATPSRRPAQSQQQRPQQSQHPQQSQRPQQTQQRRSPMPGTPSPPRNAADLKKMLQQYGQMLTPENRSFITELISQLEQGGDQRALQDLAQRMNAAAAKQTKPR